MPKSRLRSPYRPCLWIKTDNGVEILFMSESILFHYGEGFKAKYSRRQSNIGDIIGTFDSEVIAANGLG